MNEFHRGQVLVVNTARPFRFLVEAVRSDGALAGRRVMLTGVGTYFPIKGGREVIRDLSLVGAS